MDTDATLSLAEASKIADSKQITIRNWIASGLLCAYYNEKGQWEIPRCELEWTLELIASPPQHYDPPVVLSESKNGRWIRIAHAPSMAMKSVCRKCLRDEREVAYLRFQRDEFSGLGRLVCGTCWATVLSGGARLFHPELWAAAPQVGELEPEQLELPLGEEASEL